MIPRVDLKKSKDESHKKIPPGKLIVFSIFCLSILLNIYFIFFQKEGPKAESPKPPVVVEKKHDAAVKEKDPAPDGKDEKKGNLLPIAAKLSENGYTEIDFPGIGKRKVKKHSFTILKSLSHSICSSVNDDNCEHLAAYLGRLIQWEFDIYSDLRTGDKLSVLMEPNSKFEKNNILAVRFAGNKVKNFEVFFYQPLNSKYGSYFFADGNEIFPRFQNGEAPIKEFSEITSWVGDFRANTKGHTGVDFKAPVGTPVYSPFSGKVTRVNWNFKYNGGCVEIDHQKEGVKSVFLHLNKVTVKPGHYVNKGAKIGESGNTGRSFAPHLHFELRHRNNKEKIFDPFNFKFLRTQHKKIPTEEINTFKAFVEISRSFLLP